MFRQWDWKILPSVGPWKYFITAYAILHSTGSSCMQLQKPRYGLHKAANEEDPFLHEKTTLFLITKGEKKVIEYPL